MNDSHFDLKEALAVLERTPATLDIWLRGLPTAWTDCNEGPDTFSAFDVVGHLIHGERTDWLPRLERILRDGDKRAFERFDRHAQKAANEGKRLETLLDEFAELRRTSLTQLRAHALDGATLARRGLHPDLGPVTLLELLATWVVHDLGHLAQIARVMSKRYARDVGPWKAYLPVLSR